MARGTIVYLPERADLEHLIKQCEDIKSGTLSTLIFNLPHESTISVTQRNVNRVLRRLKGLRKYY